MDIALVDSSERHQLADGRADVSMLIVTFGAKCCITLFERGGGG